MEVKKCDFDLVVTGSWEHAKCGDTVKSDNLCSFHAHMAQGDKSLAREIRERKYVPFASAYVSPEEWE